MCLDENELEAVFEYFDADGDVYYHNAEMGETTWVRPTENT